MFGYVRPALGELPEHERQRFHAAYCGLCHTLGKRYGLAARFILNFDFTFLAILLGAPEEPCCGCKRCVASPFKKRTYQISTDAMDLAADDSVILAYWQLKDQVADRGFFNGLKYRLALLFLQKAYRKAGKAQPVFDASVQKQLARLKELEETKCPSIDAPADAFALLLSSIAESVEFGARQRILREMLYHLGRWIYLVDAADDMQKDQKTGNYNPLLLRYETENGRLTEASRKEFVTTIDHSARIIASAYVLGDFGSWNPILESTIQHGLFYVAKSVLDGTYEALRFHKQYTQKTI